MAADVASFGELLGREILDAVREARDVDRALRQRRGEDAEVGDLDVAVGGDDHVRRREAEVREAATMRVADGARGLRDERECAAGGERGAGEPGLGDKRADVEPGDELDGGERRALRDAELGHARDARMLEAAVCARGRRERLASALGSVSSGWKRLIAN